MSGPSQQDLHWYSPADQRSDEAMASKGLERVRTLYQMRVALPLDQAVLAATRSVDLRPFRPGIDDRGFLSVNNRAFAWHPEQGGWTEQNLSAAMAEDWFDPAGFLLHDSPTDGSIDGFCWTKVHPASHDDPAMGEIYVIAADPSTHGTGLGRALTVAGLGHLHTRGLDVGMLYVEHDNAAAVALYERLGFTVHHLHAAYAPVGAP